jgi:hypothetical protein
MEHKREAQMQSVDSDRILVTGSKRNTKHLLGRRRFALMRHDLTFPLYVAVDRILHLACPA